MRTLQSFHSLMLKLCLAALCAAGTNGALANKPAAKAKNVSAKAVKQKSPARPAKASLVKATPKKQGTPSAQAAAPRAPVESLTTSTPPPPAWCATLSKKLQGITYAQCQKAHFQASGKVSVEGRPLMFQDIPPATQQLAAHQSQPEKPLRILVVGGIHGDEMSATSIVFRWINWIQEPDARRHHWRILPLVNPDGMLANPPRRTNAHGVDLNRNFPTPDWSSDAHVYWQHATQSDPRRYPGAVPMSEPETEWLNQEIDQFDPDLIVSIHAPYGVLDYDGPAREPNRFGILRLNRLGVYPGSLGNYGGLHRNVPVVTLELPKADKLPSDPEQRKIWDDMMRWINRHITVRHLG